jgi:hypothetical protein
MVEVGVGKEDEVEPAQVDVERLAVAPRRVATALKQAAVDQESAPRRSRPGSRNR